MSNHSFCPICGGSLEVLEGKYGRFVGCSNYPACNYSESVVQGPEEIPTISQMRYEYHNFMVEKLTAELAEACNNLINSTVAKRLRGRK